MYAGTIEAPGGLGQRALDLVTCVIRRQTGYATRGAPKGRAPAGVVGELAREHRLTAFRSASPEPLEDLHGELPAVEQDRDGARGAAEVSRTAAPLAPVPEESTLPHPRSKIRARTVTPSTR